MTDLDIRLGIGGIRLDNKDAIINDINTTLNEYADILQVECNSQETYRLYKDVRKQIKDERWEIDNAIKEKVNAYTEDILTDKKALLGMYDELYDKLSAGIKAYEELHEIGAAKARITKAANKAAKDATAAQLTLSLACPSEEVKARIIQFATDLGAVVL